MTRAATTRSTMCARTSPGIRPSLVQIWAQPICVSRGAAPAATDRGTRPPGGQSALCTMPIWSFRGSPTSASPESAAYGLADLDRGEVVDQRFPQPPSSCGPQPGHQVASGELSEDLVAPQ